MSVDPVLKHRPRGARTALVVTRGISLRADLLDASRILEEAALDKYVFQRDAYLQRRRNQIYDGNPPRETSRNDAPPAAEAAPTAPGTAAVSPSASGE
jgi:phospholipid-binding lipoprotein MlaA